MSETKVTPGQKAQIQSELSDLHTDYRKRKALRGAAPDLYAALRGMFCPRPCNGRPDDLDVGDCFDAGECGCIAGVALSKARGEAS